MATIDLVRLPDDIEAGAEIGPSFRTSIIELTSGHEQRNQDWSGERLRANISYGMMRDRNDNPRPGGEIDRTFMELLAFYRARRGRARGFLFKDYTDYSSEGPVLIGTGNGVNKAFLLKIVYADAGGNYTRLITRPVANTVKCYVNGDLRAHTLGDLGLVTLSGEAPEADDEVTAEFEFDIPVRFDTDVMQVQMAWARAGEIRDIEIVGLRERG